MKFSVGKDNVNFTPVEIKKAKDFFETVTSNNWSPSLFKDDYRKLENFECAEMIALDIDNEETVTMSIEEAKEAFKDYKHAILPTRNHRKEKNGEIKDRYRVVLFLSEPITDADTFYATWAELQKKFPAIDPQAKDPSRLFYPSTECVSFNTQGKTIDPVNSNEDIDEVLEDEFNDTPKGELSKRTMKFITFGAKKGEWNASLFKAAVDCFEQGYSFDETVKLLTRATSKDLGNSGKLDGNDLKTIKSAFNRDPKYDPRIKKPAFNFMSIEDILKCEDETEWLVDKLLVRGGLSLIAGDPKAGKSTIVRQLAKSVSQGAQWLERNCSRGKVYYLALEEQKEQIKDHLRKLGIKESDNIHFHVGAAQSMSELEDLTEILEDNEIDLLVVDTLIMLMPELDLNNYQEVYHRLRPYSKLARKTGTHIMLVHHTNKGGQGTRSIAGSRALHGIVDCAMVFEVKKKKRVFNTSQRGGKSFYNRELIYVEDTESYILGPEYDEFEDDDF